MHTPGLGVGTWARASKKFRGLAAVRHCRPWLILVLVALIAANAVASVPDLQLGAIVDGWVVEEMNQQYPRAALFRDNGNGLQEAIVCYTTLLEGWGGDSTSGVFCSQLAEKADAISAGWPQSATSDGWMPEVVQVADEKVVLCYNGYSATNVAWCKVLSYQGGVLRQDKDVKPSMMTDVAIEREVRVALAPLGDSSAVICYRTVIATKCGKIDATGLTVTVPSESEEVSFPSWSDQGEQADGQREYLTLAELGSKRFAFCYSVRDTDAAKNYRLACTMLRADDVNAEGNFTSGTDILQVTASDTKYVTMTPLATDKAMICYERAPNTYCRLIAATGSTLSLEGAELQVAGSVGGAAGYAPALVQLSLNVVALCFAVVGSGDSDPNHYKAICKAIHKLSGGLVSGDVSAGLSPYAKGAGYMAMAKLNKNKAELCVLDQYGSVFGGMVWDKPLKCMVVSYPDPCTAPTGISNAAVSACSGSSTILHGSSCTSFCITGYDANVSSLLCSGGLFTPPSFRCIPRACTVTVPALGGIGDCPASKVLQSGSSCQPNCNPGYSASGTMSCSLGNLASPTCDPAPCSPVLAPENGTLGNCPSSMASGEVCTPSCTDGSALRGETSCSLGVMTLAVCYLLPSPEQVLELASPTHAAEAAGITSVVIFSCLGGCCFCCAGFVARKKENRKVLESVVLAIIHGKDPIEQLKKLDLIPGFDVLPAEDVPIMSQPDIVEDSRMLICFSHHSTQNQYVKRGINYMSEHFLLDQLNFVFQDRPAKGNGGCTDIEWRWQWLVGATIAKSIVCVVDRDYLGSNRCNREYMTAQMSKKRVVILMDDKAKLGLEDSELAPLIEKEPMVIDGTGAHMEVFDEVCRGKRLFTGQGERMILASRFIKRHYKDKPNPFRAAEAALRASICQFTHLKKHPPPGREVEAVERLCLQGHPLEALGTSRDNGWKCNGIGGGCMSGIKEYNQTSGMKRYRCQQCDYDLCHKCFTGKDEFEVNLEVAPLLPAGSSSPDGKGKKKFKKKSSVSKAASSQPENDGEENFGESKSQGKSKPKTIKKKAVKPKPTKPEEIQPFIRSQKEGKTHPDTKVFDDSAAVEGMTSDRFFLSEVHLWSSKFVNGVQVAFSIDGETSLQMPHYGENDAPLTRDSLVLEPGEFITKVSGRDGLVMDHLEITTSAGRKISAGDSSGGEGFKWEIPAGERFVCFFGGTGGHLHNIGIVTQALSASASGPVTPMARASNQDSMTLQMRNDATATGPGLDGEGASGLIFNIVAKQDLELTAIHVGHFSSPSTCDVWINQGVEAFQQCWQEGSSEGWQSVASYSYDGPDHADKCITLSPSVDILAGQTKAVYIHAPNGRLVAGTEAYGEVASNDALSVYAGDCGKPERWERFNVSNYELAGAVEYKLL